MKEIDAAIKETDTMIDIWIDAQKRLYEKGEKVVGSFEDERLEHYKTIRTALLVYKKLMDEPTEAMLREGRDAWSQDNLRRSSTLFKAMSDQLIREVEEDV